MFAREHSQNIPLHHSPSVRYRSRPGWMTSTDNWIGGHLLPEYYTVYANYFVKFIQAYAEAGIPIHAVTIQNEPGVNRDIDDPTWYYPSCQWTGEQERTGILRSWTLQDFPPLAGQIPLEAGRTCDLRLRIKRSADGGLPISVDAAGLEPATSAL